MKKICTICARGGSKGVKNKNIRSFGGVPLIGVTIQQALDSGEFDTLAVSSDSDEILEVARRFKVPHLIKRSSELATDQAPKLPVIKDCVRSVEKITGEQYGIMVDLDATSPLRTPQDIKNAIQLLIQSGATNVITGNESRKSPYFNLVEEDSNHVLTLSKSPTQPIFRRQDTPKCYDLNASIYAWKREAFWDLEKIIVPTARLYEMPLERSIDIDSEVEFLMAEFLFLHAKTKGK